MVAKIIANSWFLGGALIVSFLLLLIGAWRRRSKESEVDELLDQQRYHENIYGLHSNYIYGRHSGQLYPTETEVKEETTDQTRKRAS